MIFFDPGQPSIGVSLQTTTWRDDPSNPLEIGFRVECDIPHTHPRFQEILEFFRTLTARPQTIDDARKILDLLQ